MHHQLFSNTLSATGRTSTGDKLGGVQAPALLKLRDLGRSRFMSLTNQYAYPEPLPLKGGTYSVGPPRQDESEPCMINLTLVLDKLPPAPPGVGAHVQLVEAGVPVESVADKVFDVAKLMSPSKDASASDARIKKNSKYMDQRMKCAVDLLHMCQPVQVETMGCHWCFCLAQVLRLRASILSSTKTSCVYRRQRLHSHGPLSVWYAGLSCMRQRVTGSLCGS